MTRSQCTLFSLMLATAGAGCGAAPPEADEVALVQSAVTGNIVISGRVTNSSGTGLGNVTVTLAGSASTSQQTTTTGAYSFGGLASGSYSVRPTRTNCGFTPDVVNLNNLNASTTRNFVGSGAGCAAAPPRHPDHPQVHVADLQPDHREPGRRPHHHAQGLEQPGHADDAVRRRRRHGQQQPGQLRGGPAGRAATPTRSRRTDSSTPTRPSWPARTRGELSQARSGRWDSDTRSITWPC